jgi:hypothetical protein
VVEIYPADSVYNRLMPVSLYHNGGRHFLSEDIYILRTMTSKVFGKQLATAVHTSSHD